VSALLEKRLLFVTGKGGVGKSTVALALGIAAAAQGRRTIVCELAAQEHASRTFRRAEIGFHEVELRKDLWAISLDPDHSMREYILLQTRIRAMGDMLYRSRIFNYLAAATPGLREMVTIGKIWELAQLDRKVKRGRAYDLVIVDAPATGHGIGFLQTPKTFAEVARVGPIHAQAKTIHALLTNPELAGAAIVSLPEEMAVNESAELERELTESVGIAVDRVFLNGLYGERISNEEVERLDVEASSPSAAAALRAAISQRHRAETQLAQRTRLEGLVKAPVSTLPFMFEPRLGAIELDGLAERVS
jgi:anion-transporting  ArsA/GET3 family ATPase